MANQRMFIKCNVCGDEKFLAKRLMSAYRTLDMTMNADKWDEWFEKHEWGFCGSDSDHGLDVFSLSYEHVDEDGNPSGA